MRLMLFLFLNLSFLLAENSQTLIKYALQKHHSLHSIQARLSAMDAIIQKSQNWRNPDVSVSISDIQLRKPLDRKIEPMQYQALLVKQRFPWFGKLAAKKTLYQYKKQAIFYSLKEAQLQLAYHIKTTIFQIKETKARMEIIEKYLHIAKQNVKLYTDYISTEAMSHSQSISAILSVSKLEIKKERYLSRYKIQKQNLNYLVQKKVKYLSQKLKINPPKRLGYYLSKLKNNPRYQQKHSTQHIAKTQQTLSDLSLYPDPYVQVGYFNRSNYTDFVSVSVGVSLPLYGTENLEREIAQKETLATQHERLDYKATLINQIHAQHARLTEAYHIYHILQNKSLPQLEHLLELASSAIEKGEGLFNYTKILEQKLALEEERIAIISTFMQTQAQLHTLIGKK